ncbi:winged helix-turn-helix transcriptional regulator [Halopenitus sp. H-Gu1]|uniref:winged helix-turn-helix transcriptional regulator n=1 Tax=Halopenitus sp. H-Gu1 TaxID=3242697 RepID=UPI00359E9CCA
MSSPDPIEIEDDESSESTENPESTPRSDAAEAVSDAACPIVDSLEQIGSRWRLVVLHELQNDELRFNELKRETDANARTLSRVLDDLQELGFVNRRLEEAAPVATYYSLTPKGRSLCPVFEEIEQWANEWLAACDDETGMSTE